MTKLYNHILFSLISFATVILTLLLVACDKKELKESVVDYRSEAKALCEVFNPEKWENIPKNLTPVQIQQKITVGIEAAVHSGKMKEVIQTIPKIPAEIRYQYLAESIGALTGEPYSCPGLEDYLNPL